MNPTGELPTTDFLGYSPQMIIRGAAARCQLQIVYLLRMSVPRGLGEQVPQSAGKNFHRFVGCLYTQ